MLHFYRNPALTESETKRFIEASKMAVATEWCFCVETKGALSKDKLRRLEWLLSETFEQDQFGTETALGIFPTVLMVGPRLNFETPFSSEAVAICHACGLERVTRLEKFLRFGLPVENVTEEQARAILAPFHDRMTQMPYQKLPDSLNSGLEPEPVHTIPVLKQDKEALQQASREMGLGFDKQDEDMIYHLFAEVLKMEIIQAPWKTNPGNSVLAFCDDSSAIRGSMIDRLMPALPGYPSSLVLVKGLWHPTLTAETHNHPSAFAPYPGAETGTGRRIRDNNAVARGGLVGVGGAAYCTGNLCIPGYDLPWENDSWQQPPNMASPLQIMLEKLRFRILQELK